MTTTDETKPTGGQAPPPPPGWSRAAKRYGPIVAIVAVIAAAVVVFGGGDDDGGDGDETGEAGSSTQEQLILDGPMTPERARLEGIDPSEIDFGPNCDTDIGRIKLPTVYAPPCVEPFDGDNGGATSPGVTADTVKVVYYQTDPALDPLTAATVEGAGADVDPASAAET